MATMTTIDGLQIAFNPNAVVGVADHDALTGAAVTCVYGITPAGLRIAETASDFLARLKMAKKFGSFVRPNGARIWIAGASVSSLRPPLTGEFIAGVNTVIFAEQLTQGVKESPADAMMEINAHGGDL
jgi:hypothetical protein